MNRVLDRFRRDRSGTTAIEYVLIAGLIACAIIASVRPIGKDVNAILTSIAAKLN